MPILVQLSNKNIKYLTLYHMPNVDWNGIQNLVLKFFWLYHNITSHAMPVVVQLSNKNIKHLTLYHMPNVDWNHLKLEF